MVLRRQLWLLLRWRNIAHPGKVWRLMDRSIWGRACIFLIWWRMRVRVCGRLRSLRWRWSGYRAIHLSWREGLQIFAGETSVAKGRTREVSSQDSCTVLTVLQPPWVTLLKKSGHSSTYNWRLQRNSSWKVLVRSFEMHAIQLVFSKAKGIYAIGILSKILISRNTNPWTHIQHRTRTKHQPVMRAGARLHLHFCAM